MNAGSQPKFTGIYRNRLAVWADKYLFLLMFFGGTLAIVLMKRFGVGQIKVTAVPVCAMCLYGAYVLLTPRYRVQSDRAGDSLYYLGFLFTMVSLAYSLYEFRGEETSTQLIVTNFGVALATTILGLMLRVVYHQLRDDPFDVEQEARIELAQAANLLHGVLLKAVSDFDTLRTTVCQVLGEAADDAKARLERVVEEVTSATKAQQEFLTSFSKEAAAELTDHHKVMLQASRSMTNGVLRCAERVDKVEIPPDAIKNRLDAVDIPANLIKERLEQVEIPWNIIKERLEGVDVPPNIIRERLEQVQIPPEIFAGRFDRIVEQLMRVFEQLSEATGRESRAMQALEQVVNQACKAAENLKAAVTGAGIDAEAQRKQVKDALTGLSETLTNLETMGKAAFDLSSTNVQQQQQLLNELASSSAAALKMVEGHTQQLQGELKSSAAAVGQVHGSLVSLTKTVVEKLNGHA